MCLMSVMTPMEFSRAEYSALFRRNIRNLRYRSSGWYASLAGARNHCEGSVFRHEPWTNYNSVFQSRRERNHCSLYQCLITLILPVLNPLGHLFILSFHCLLLDPRKTTLRDKRPTSALSSMSTPLIVLVSPWCVYCNGFSSVISWKRKHILIK
jgi:hypothetical protein